MSKTVSGEQPTTDALCVNTIRGLAMDAVQKANSGHPGAPMGLAPAAYVLWTRYLKHNPKNSDWLDRDRFVLSGGHASMLLYSLLHLSGYDLDLEEIKNFRQWGSKTPGHPEYRHTDGVETTTGPLGQGIANAVGMALAESHLAARFNRKGHTIVDHHTYVMCGDGDLMEGVAAEAASLAGHLALGKLICIYDDNGISIEGSTAIAFTENVGLRFESYGWQVLTVDDGNNLLAIADALEAARSEADKPSLIKLKTEIAYGSPHKQGTADAHGAPLGEEELILTKQNLGIPVEEPFLVPDEVRSHFENCMAAGAQAEAAWLTAFKAYNDEYPELADQWVDAMSGFLPEDWQADIPAFSPGDGPLATRAASGQVLNALAEKVPTLIGGSADLAPSNKTYLACSHEFQKGARDGRNIRFGVREHAMGAIMTGMFVHNGLRPYGGTFLVFADYVRPAIRVASLMKVPLIYVFTHDSIAVGEDGPTHQPVEHLAALRAIPGLTVIRPADATETAKAWCQALQTGDHPVALILSRQKLPILESSLKDKTLQQGAYILSDCEGAPDILLMASGSEVHLVLEAQKELAADGIAARVISMPSWELFEKTGSGYQRQVLPPDVKKRLAVEAGISMGWEKFVGDEGAVVSMRSFGASAPGPVVMKKFGFSVAHVVSRARDLLGR